MTAKSPDKFSREISNPQNPQALNYNKSNLKSPTLVSNPCSNLKTDSSSNQIAPNKSKRENNNGMKRRQNQLKQNILILKQELRDIKQQWEKIWKKKYLNDLHYEVLHLQTKKQNINLKIKILQQQLHSIWMGSLLIKGNKESIRVKKQSSSKIQKIRSALLISQCRQMKLTIKGIQSKSYQSINSGINDGQNNITAFFQGDALRGDDDYRISLYQALKHLFNRPFTYTRLIYRYDPLNTTNIHCYIDNQPHIVLIARLENGAHIAAYSQYSFNPRMVKKGNGMLFSLTNRRSYTVKAGKCSIVYDENYLIFGNTELRISSHDNRLYSNFGISSGYYEANGDNIHNFIGTSQRQITFQHLEIFQLLFDQ